jgi:Fe2+ or Zn2+ uptake regulation protein
MPYKYGIICPELGTKAFSMATQPHSDTAAEESNPDEAVRQVFRAAGLRVTRQRLTLLRLLREAGGFLSAEQLYTRAQSDGERLSLATVYRALALFKQLGLAEGRVVGEQDREEFRYRFQREQYTLTCKRCGAVVAVASDIVDEFRRELHAQLGVTGLTAHTCFVGYCARCLEKMAAESTHNEGT